MDKLPIIGWFSCGATSAVACKMALSMYDNVRIVYIETNSGHPDNKRFLRQCEEWYGQQIEVIHSDKYKDVDDVLLRKKFINSPYGASCTKYLKKEVRYAYEDKIKNWGGKFGGLIFAQRR